MNQSTNEGGLGYDPCDRHSFPYQANDPPFDATSLEFDDVDLSTAADLVLNNYFVELTNRPYFDGANGYRTIDMALRLFLKKANASELQDIALPDIFAVCLEQAFIWEVG